MTMDKDKQNFLFVWVIANSSFIVIAVIIFFCYIYYNSRTELIETVSSFTRQNIMDKYEKYLDNLSYRIVINNDKTFRKELILKMKQLYNLDISTEAEKKEKNNITNETSKIKNLLLPKERITSVYGIRKKTRPQTGYLGTRIHLGIDYGMVTGTPIKSIQDGVIEKISWNTMLGKYIIIRHNGYNNSYKSLYGHLSKADYNRVGDFVRRGDIIAKSGNTGRTTGPHLHMAIIDNKKYINPLRYAE